MKNFPDNCQVIRVEDDNELDQKRANAIKYWCNACGELHHHGKFDISEEELPKPLRRAYNTLWEEGAAGCCCYLVETKEVGYGIALIAEYDEYYAKECGLTMDEMFDMLLKDMESLAAYDALWCAHLYALEYAGCNECHELAIVLPANLPQADWEAVKDAVEVTVYSHSKEIRTSHLMVEKLRKYHEDIGDYDIEFGEIYFRTPDYAEVPIKYKWKLNAWEKSVERNEVLVRVNGYWNLAVGFGFERFKA